MKASLTEMSANPWRTLTARILEITSEIDGIVTCRLGCDQLSSPSEYQFVPGQFNMLYLPGVGESAISMSGDAEASEGWIHTVRVVGNVTRTFAKLTVGDTLGVRGPFGSGWPIEELVGGDVILVAGGLGLAPLRPLIYHLVRHRERYGAITLIIGARTAETLLFPSEYDIWQRQGLNVQVTVDRATGGWNGNVGVVTAILDRCPIPNPDATRLVSCGPEVMMKYAALSGVRRRISADHIWVSMERNMQCAVGLCGHCQWGPSFVCKDGPVLRYDRIRPYFAVESL